MIAKEKEEVVIAEKGAIEIIAEDTKKIDSILDKPAVVKDIKKPKNKPDAKATITKKSEKTKEQEKPIMNDLVSKQIADIESKTSKAKSSVAKPKEGTSEWCVNTTKFLKDTPIKYVSNPKREGCSSWIRYEKYKEAKTFGEYLELNPGKFSMADARHDLQKEFLKIVDDEYFDEEDQF